MTTFILVVIGGIGVVDVGAVEGRGKKHLCRSIEGKTVVSAHDASVVEVCFLLGAVRQQICDSLDESVLYSILNKPGTKCRSSHR